MDDSTVWTILDRYVQRRMESHNLEHVHTYYVDEKAMRKGHDYLSTFLDQDHRVIFVGEGNSSNVIHEFVRHISGKSSYEMISGIKEFYVALNSGELESGCTMHDTDKIRREYEKVLCPKLRWKYGVQVKDLCELFNVSRNTIGSWTLPFKPVDWKTKKEEGKEDTQQPLTSV